VCRQERGHLLDHSKGRGGRSGFAEKRLCVFAEEQDLSGLASVIDRLPVPRAIRIGTAKGGLHRGAQHGRAYRAAKLEIGEDDSGRRDQRVGDAERGIVENMLCGHRASPETRKPGAMAGLSKKS
jgi:hypothetical protein